MERKKSDPLKLLRGPLDAESRGNHESGLRIDCKLRYEVENRVLPVFYLHLPPFTASASLRDRRIGGRGHCVRIHEVLLGGVVVVVVVRVG